MVGSGYVGMIMAVGLAEMDHDVICLDVDEDRIRMINQGVAPIHEPGLDELLHKHTGEKIRATGSYDDAIGSSDISVICVGTPSAEDGRADLSMISNTAEDIGKVLRNIDNYHVVVVKSTVPPGTTEETVLPLLEKNSDKKVSSDFGLAMNPEFLQEGSALHNFMNPDRIVIGSFDQRSGDIVASLYAGFDVPVLRTDIKTAEMIKYAANSLLATKISFSNEIGNICKQLGIDVYKVMEGVGLDRRISPLFLRAGAGFGGSCFPKDVEALVAKAEEMGCNSVLLRSVLAINDMQPLHMIELLRRYVPDLAEKRIAVLGLAFKNNTDDIRESRSILVIEALLREKVRVSAYDPLANDNMRQLFPDVEYCASARDALRDADACLVMTEWREFSDLGEGDFGVMRNMVVIDGRHIIKPVDGMIYEGLCW